MAFWIFMLVICLIIPLSMLGFGRLFMIRPPKSINAAFGYRTAMSMKNRDTWDFAHRLIGRLWFRCGLVLLPLSVVPLLFVIGRDAEAVGRLGTIVAAVQLILMMGSIFPVEAALRRNFDKNGARR